MHWGYFENLAQTDPETFLPACQRWNEYMLAHSNITNESYVLDLGCGNGNTSLWLAHKTGCTVVGVDLSRVRIQNAISKSQKYPDIVVNFQKASANNLPFKSETFTHVWSQATLCHVHDRPCALREVFRVLQEGGFFIFDDLVTPKSEVSAVAKQCFYDRVLLEPTFSQATYANCLNKIGFVVCENQDLTEHLKKSYELLGKLAKPKYPELSSTYQKVRKVIDNQELGWSFYKCQK